MPQGTRLQGATHAFTGADFLRVRSRDFGGGQLQFVVGTTQAIGDTLAAYLCDPDKNRVAAIHPGPPITFETDSDFVIESSAAVTVVYGLLQFGGARGAPPSVGGGSSGSGGSDGGGDGGGTGPRGRRYYQP